MDAGESRKRRCTLTPQQPSDNINSHEPVLKFGSNRNATSSKLSMSSANGKRKAVVDLTDDDNDIPKRRSASGVSQLRHPAPETSVASTASADERFARELQAQLDVEYGAQNVSGGFPHINQNALEDDARLACELQSALDREDFLADQNYEFSAAGGVVKDDDEPASREIREQTGHDYAIVSQDTSSGLLLPSRPEDSENATPQSPEAAVEMIRNHGQDVMHIPCAGCGKNHLKTENDVVLQFKQWLGGSDKSVVLPYSSVGPPVAMIASSALKCSKSSSAATTCMGCGKRGSDGYTGDERILEDGRVITWHCDRGRLFLLWAMLCGYDRRQTVNSRRDSHFAKLKVRNSGPSSGTGYGGSNAYGSSSMYGSPPISAGKYGTHIGSSAHPVHPVKVADSSDGVAEKVMTWLVVLLPSLKSKKPSAFDLDPPSILPPLLARSAILGTLAELLRNDSLEDANQRLNLYRAALALVNTLGSHPATASAAIHQERQLCEDAGMDMLKLSYLTKASGGGKYDKTRSLAACLKNLEFQSKLMLDNAGIHPNDYKGLVSQQMLSLCRSVCEVADFLLAKSTITAGRDDWHVALAVLELPDEDILVRHSYAAESGRMQNPRIGRMKSLSLQVASLKTSLPPGIFVRYCASRLDVMKILVVGPKSTPYENGLFEFDLHCPANYPNGPPKMTFRTTGGGTVSFNPNLYKHGKVCLSLLGTWAGEPWQPRSSTILQVLISIQAMIFCDEPWCNEPGREQQLRSDASIKYNSEIQGYTVQHAMLGWLQGSLDPVWGDVVTRHFSANATEIVAAVNQWTAAGAKCSAHARQLVTVLQGMGA